VSECQLGRVLYNIYIKKCICNLNQQSEFTFYKLILCLLQCLVGESSSGESTAPQIRSIGQFLLSRLFSSLTSSVEYILLVMIIWLIRALIITRYSRDDDANACTRKYFSDVSEV
jgi:hypothetical protein